MGVGSNQSMQKVAAGDFASLLAAAIAGGASTLGDVVTELQNVVTALGDLADLKTYTDGLEAALTTTNDRLADLKTYTDSLETYTDGLETLLTDLKTLLTTPGGKTLKFASITETGSAQEVIAAAGASKSIRVCMLHFMCSAACTVQWFSGVTALTGAMTYPANGGLAISLAPPMCMFKTADNTALNVTISAGTITGFMVYWDSDAA